VPNSEYAHSEQTLREIDLEVKRIIDQAAITAREILTRRRDVLEHMARELVEKEVVDAEQSDRIIDEKDTTPQRGRGTNVSIPAPAPSGLDAPPERSTGSKAGEAM